MSNKKLFEIRKISWKAILGYSIFISMISFCLIISCVNVKKEDNEGNKENTFSFLKFHGKKQYEPLNDISTNKGLYGKINVALQSALNDLEEGKVNKNLNENTLNKTFKRLKFSFPTQEGYLMEFQEIRLTEFLPNPNNKQEIDFFYNSDFRRILEKQEKNMEKPYFIIDWDKNNRSIKSIRIDQTLGDVPLKNTSWKGIIKIDDPFCKVDENVIYLMKDNIPIPLFSSNRPDSLFSKYQNLNDSSFYKIKISDWEKRQLNNFDVLYGELNEADPRKSKSIKIDFGNNQYISFLNSNGKIKMQWNAIRVTVVNGSDSSTFSEEQSNYSLLTPLHHIVQIYIHTGKNKHIFYMTKKAFSTASEVSNNMSRINIDEKLTDLSFKQQLRHITNNFQDDKPIDSLTITSNPFLSTYLENEMKKYVTNTLKNKAADKIDEFQMSITLMDISTGEIIAVPFYSNNLEKINLDVTTEIKNYNFSNHDIGSCFKPLLSFAAVKRYPALKDFSFLIGNEYSTDYADDKNAKILGYRTERYGAKRGSKLYSAFWGGCADFKSFLATSHDNYPIALALLALSEADNPSIPLLKDVKKNNSELNKLALLNNHKTSYRIGYNPNEKNEKRRLFFNDRLLEKSEFAQILESIYNVNAGSRNTIGMIYYDTLLWRNLQDREMERKLQSITHDQVFFRLDKITTFKDFEVFVIGQGNNQWNNVKLAEAYSRLLSKKKIAASMLKNPECEEAWLDKNSLPVWNNFMKNWQEAVKISHNLLTPAYRKLKAAIPDFDDKFYFYCKTGTPQENQALNNYFINSKKEKIWRDEGLFAFGITNKDLENPKGIVGVVYIRHLSEKKPGTGVESSTARDFLTSELYKKIIFYNKTRFEK